MNVLFDLDGTLTDPRWGFIGCIRHALTAMGRRCPPEAELATLIGPPLQQTFTELLAGDAADVATAVDLYRDRFSRIGMFENAVYPGIEEALQALSATGAALFVATSKPTLYAKRILEHFRLSGYFRSRSELDSVRREAQLIAYVLAAERLPRARAVGDRSRHERCRRQRVRAVGALWGYDRATNLAAGFFAVRAPFRPRRPRLSGWRGRRRVACIFARRAAARAKRRVTAGSTWCRRTCGR
jgi:phosphoglycolate phosphatase